MIELKTGGQIFSGWKTLEVTRGIEQIAGEFRIGLTERWSDREFREIRDQEPCQLLLDGAPVITGYVDEWLPAYDKQTHDIQVAGRDKTADLVDCSAIHAGGQWKNVPLEHIARDLCQPFGITVKVEADTGDRFASFNIEEGETVFECLDRAARLRARLLVSDALGNLVITSAGKVRAPIDLVEGDNILRAAGQISSRERFSKYVLKGQSDGGAAASHIKAESADSSVSRYRPLIVLAEETEKRFQRRADWERNVRAGRARRATITVQGWSHARGLWVPNQLVKVSAPMLRCDRELLIVQVTYRKDEQGEFADLTLCHPAAFELIDGIKGTALNRKVSGTNGAADRSRRDRKKKRDDDFGWMEQP